MTDRAASLLVAVAIAVCGVIALYAHGRSLRAALHDNDFAAFYCAGTLVRQGADPYRAQPLADCERANVAASLGAAFSARDLDPAPLPGYAIAPFVPLSLLPYPVAALLWDAILLAAIVASVEMLAALTSLRRPALAAGFVATGVIASLPYGQLAPIAVFGLCAAALSLVRGRYVIAGVGCAFALLQPQTGIAALLALALWAPRTRAAIAMVAACAAVLSLATLGLAENVEYARAVLPAQALAEAPFGIQLSATWLLHFAGLDDARAVSFAQIEYGLLLAAGIVFAKPLVRALGSEAALVLFPPVAALAGGTYLHVFALTAAVPFAALLAARARGPNSFGWGALALLSVAWQGLDSHALLLLGAIAAATIAWFAAGGKAITTRAAMAAVVALLVLAAPAASARITDSPRNPRPAVAAFEQAGIDSALASFRHGRTIREDRTATDDSWRTFVGKAPFWAAILLLLAGALAAAGTPLGGKGEQLEGPPDSLETLEAKSWQT